MRVLFTIPHYVRRAGDVSYGDRTHGSLEGSEPRADALTACVTALHQQFAPDRCEIDHGQRRARAVPADLPYSADVVICTTGDRHLLDGLPAVRHSCQHRTTDAAPELLGFACHDVLREGLGRYDYYCYLEDDLILHDPWLFVKLAWFSGATGDDRLLQPNRFEAGLGHLVPKVYIDGPLARHVTAPFLGVADSPRLELEAVGRRVLFERALNPHSGCFFLNARQMQHWVSRAHFGDRESRLIGPLETAATLGIVRTFEVYKPALPHADFLEVQHHATGYLSQLCAPEGGGTSS